MTWRLRFGRSNWHELDPCDKCKWIKRQHQTQCLLDCYCIYVVSNIRRVNSKGWRLWAVIWKGILTCIEARDRPSWCAQVAEHVPKLVPYKKELSTMAKLPLEWLVEESWSACTHPAQTPVSTCSRLVKKPEQTSEQAIRYNGWGPYMCQM